MSGYRDHYHQPVIESPTTQALININITDLHSLDYVFPGWEYLYTERDEMLQLSEIISGDWRERGRWGLH